MFGGSRQPPEGMCYSSVQPLTYGLGHLASCEDILA